MGTFTCEKVTQPTDSLEMVWGGSPPPSGERVFSVIGMFSQSRMQPCYLSKMSNPTAGDQT